MMSMKYIFKGASRCRSEYNYFEGCDVPKFFFEEANKESKMPTQLTSKGCVG